jgi:hypothetical protein
LNRRHDERDRYARLDDPAAARTGEHAVDVAAQVDGERRRSVGRGRSVAHHDVDRLRLRVLALQVLVDAGVGTLLEQGADIGCDDRHHRIRRSPAQRRSHANRVGDHALDDDQTDDEQHEREPDAEVEAPVPADLLASCFKTCGVRL